MDRHQKARMALRKSIKHWMLDIVRPLRKGRTINPIDLSWYDTDKKVKSGASHCALCKEYLKCFSNDFAEYATDYGFGLKFLSADRLDGFGYVCPLFLAQRDICGGSDTAWELFINKPKLETAEMMVSDLVKCYKEYV